MLYTVDMEIEIDVQDAFDELTKNEKQKFIDENIDRASDECLVAKVRERGLKIEDDANYRELVNRASSMFLVGGMAARDFLTDSLGLQHTVNLDVIIYKLKQILQ